MVKRTIRSAATVILVLALLVLSGCGANGQVKAMEDYKSGLTSICDQLAACNDTLKGIDPESEDAQKLLLSTVDDIARLFNEAAQLPAPDGYSRVQETAKSAAGRMQEANEAYHKAFEADTFDQKAFKQAQEAYHDANGQLQDLLSLLHSSARD
ncbi:MAG: hypothetical protein PUF49_07520 [Firmicutes bacterium]|nr:hypothetical protein [Bacillota bacterium]